MLRMTLSELRDISRRGTDEESGRRIVVDHPQLLREILDDNLTKKQKCYIMMYYGSGMTVSEIAVRCGVNKSTVSRTIARGRKHIKELLGCKLVKHRIEAADHPQSKDSELK